MSRWVEGRSYNYYGHAVTCDRRYFSGPLELVVLRFADLGDCLTRTARALAPCVEPRVTETLGGVTRPSACPHDWYPRVTADAGPHVGRECCSACGTPPECSGSWDGYARNHYHLLVTHLPRCGK